MTVVHVFPSFGIGGAQMRAVQLANWFGARQRHVVISIDNDYGSRTFLHPEIEIASISPPFEKGAALRHLPTIRRILAAHGAELLLTYNWGSIEWALANRLSPVVPRHIHFEDGFGPEEVDRQIPRRVWFRRLALSGRQSKIVVPSQTLREIATGIWRFSDRRVFYVPNGIDLGRFRAVGATAPAPGFVKQPGEIVIGTVARLRPEKNLRRMISAFATLQKATAQSCRLLIVGDGSERVLLEEHARNLGLQERVVFFGATERPEALLAAMDIFTLSSDTEQMPISVLEAMACGLAVASPDVGDVANMVAAENAQLVRGVRSAEGLATALRTLCEDTALRARLGTANRAKAEQEFDENVMLARYEQLFAAPSTAS